MKVVAPSGAGRGVWGWRSPSTTALQFRYPRRGACARIIPTWGLNCRCPSARRGWAALKCAARLPNDGSAAFPCAALVRAFAFLQRLPLELPTPPRRARCIECASIVPCLPSRSAGRKPREGGGRFCEVGTTPRTTNRRIGACFASRGLRFASAILAATWTQRGRCGDALRGPRESFVHWGRRHAARFKRDVSGTRTQRRDLHRQGGAGLHVLPFPLVHLSPELH